MALHSLRLLTDVQFFLRQPGKTSLGKWPESLMLRLNGDSTGRKKDEEDHPSFRVPEKKVDLLSSPLPLAFPCGSPDDCYFPEDFAKLRNQKSIF